MFILAVQLLMFSVGTNAQSANDIVERVTTFFAERGGSEPMGEISYDPMFREIANFVVQHQQGSTSYIQRRFTIGYTRAARIMDQLESAGIVGPVDGGKPREVLVYDMGELARILEGLGL